MIPTWRTYLIQPISFPVRGAAELDPSKIAEPISLTFRVEHMEYPIFPIPDPEPSYCYYCESCYYASGNRELVFRTMPASAKEMKDGPTEEQREQVNDHARQHQIMLAWAKGLEK